MYIYGRKAGLVNVTRAGKPRRPIPKKLSNAADTAAMYLLAIGSDRFLRCVSFHEVRKLTYQHVCGTYWVATTTHLAHAYTHHRNPKITTTKSSKPEIFRNLPKAPKPQNPTSR